jgi:hypothetical protein
MLPYKIRKYLFVAAFFLFALQSFAQDKPKITPQDYENQEVEMADRMRADGKIYVVVSVISILLAGILTYTIVIDRKLGRLEKELEMERN